MKPTQVWIWRSGQTLEGTCAFRRPGWDDGPSEPEWYAANQFNMCARGTRLFCNLIGLSRLPPAGEAWQVRIIKPGECKILKKLKGGEQ